MNDEKADLLRQLHSEGIPFALIEDDRNSMRILSSPASRDRIKKLLREQKWARIKKRDKDIYLYGMDHFLYFKKGSISLTICFQLACRSTLHGEWVPLDRKINHTALAKADHSRVPPSLCPEDELCYLLAKCVYTEKCFSDDDQSRIKRAVERVDERLLMPKIE